MAERTDRYQGLDKDIASELQGYEHNEFKIDAPVKFNNLLIYPATVKDYEIFSACVGCLTLNKNETPQGLKMTNLEYLIFKMNDKEEGPMWSFRVQKLFELIFHIQNGLKCQHCNSIVQYGDDVFVQYIKDLQQALQDHTQPPIFKCPHCGDESGEFLEMIKIITDENTKKPFLLVNGQPIKNKDFNRLRQIVMYQNFPDYQDDSWVDDAVKKDYEARMKLEAQKNDVHATIEKKIVCLSVATHYKFEEIYNMTIRKFTMALATVDDLINYKITKSAMMSGLVSFPKDFKLEHWIYKPDKDLYGEAYKDLDQVKADVGSL